MRASDITCTDALVPLCGRNRFARNLILDNETQVKGRREALLSCVASPGPNVGRSYGS